MKKKTIIFSVLASLIVGLLLIFLPAMPRLVQAQNANELRGWGWSSNIGWISFNSKDTENFANPSNVPYAVTIDSSNNLIGYAWSSNIGWIRFDPSLVGPNGGGDNFGARLESGSLKGWARVCSVYVNGCEGAVKTVSGTELGGWDGWIKMDNITYNASAGTFAGFAWGALNTGWVDLSKVTVGPGNCSASGETPPPACCTGLTQCNGTGPCVDPSTCTITPPGCNLPGTPANNCCNNSEYKICNASCIPIGETCITGGCTDGVNCPENCSDNIDNDNNGFKDCDDHPACDLASNCIQVPPECKFTIDETPGWIELTFGNTGDYQYSPNGASLTIKPDGCTNNLNLNSPDFPTGTIMVCKVNNGSWGSCNNINGSDGDSIKVGVKARRSDIDKDELDASGCKVINITNSVNSANSFPNEVCFSGSYGN